MTAKRWEIIDEEFISYTGGTAQLISNGECEIHLWERPKDAQLFCDKLNELHEEVMDLRRENTKFKLIVSEIIEDMQKYVDDNQLVYINQSYVDWIKKEVDTTLYSQKKELEE